MVRSIILGLVLFGLVALGYVAYLDLRAKRALISGDVVPGPADAVSPSHAMVPDRSSAVSSSVAGSGGSPSNASGNLSSPEMYARVPATDSITPNPPNGIVFAGNGRFEVYRQGNLTWRIDTETGRNCVLFATNEEWQRPQVYRNGCRDNAGTIANPVQAPISMYSGS